jgi:class 3 adenylate cyclase/tetratricopeptide (TPR) repeat protein
MAKDAQSSIGAPDTYTPEHLAHKILNSKATLEGERKQVTVLFADLKSSMELLADRDPEDARKLLDPVLEFMMEAVHHYEGTVNQAAGDGIMALFGAPLAHEDHAVRACFSALRMQERVKRHAESVFRAHGVNVQIRVGLNSGEVIVGTIRSDLRMDYTAVGRTTHLAARMEQLASPGNILLTPSTLKLAEGFVTVKSLGMVPVKGLAVPLEIHELTGVGAARTRFHVVAQRGLTQFVGRDAELASLESALQRAAEGDGCVVGIVAEAGVGKSRLCFEFVERCRARGMPVLTGGALAHGRATPYLPMINAMKAYCGIKLNDSPELARETVSKRLRSIDFGFAEAIPLLLDFIGIADPSVEGPRLDPAVRRERLHSMFRPLIRAAVLHRPGTGPVVTLLEDLHWMDPGSESLVEVLVDALRGMNSLLIVNYRAGYTAPWMKSDHFDQISLTSLPRLEADALAAELLGEDQSVTSLLPLIADRARGNPLFIEELVRQLEEGGHLAGARGAYRLVRAPDPRFIPDTVQTTIGARIDRRPESEKSVLQTAAVIGRDFAMPVLARIIAKPEVELASMLGRLAKAGLVQQMGSGEETFSFAHPMMQEVAYGSMLSERRRSLHAAVATELEKTWSDPDGAQASLIAHHWEEAGNPMRATSCYISAASWYGTPDLTRPLAWDGTRDPPRAFDAWKQARRLMLELPLEGQAKALLVWADAQIMNMGLRSDSLTPADAEPYYLEAMAVAQSLSDTRLIVILAFVHAWVQELTGSIQNGISSMTEVLSVLDNRKDASLRVILTFRVGQMLRLGGDLPRALQMIDEALAHTHEIVEADRKLFNYPIADYAKSIRGRILTMMGRCDEARGLLDELCGSKEAVVRVLAHFGLIDMAWGLNDIAQASKHLEMVTRFAESSGNVPWLPATRLHYAGLVQSMRAEYSRAAETLTNALEIIRRGNTLLQETRILGDLAYAQLRMGLKAQARSTAEEAASTARRRGAKVWLAYAEWVIAGPSSPIFRKLMAETGAELLMRLPHPSWENRRTN